MKYKYFVILIMIIFLFSSCFVACNEEYTNDLGNIDTQNTEEEQKADYGFFYFGEYPQTIASSEASYYMRRNAEEDGYYISDYDNARYTKVIADPYTGGYNFSNNETIIMDRIYYFKIEPIKWIVLKIYENGSKLLLTEKIIDYGSFLKYENMKYQNTYWFNNKIETPNDIYANNWQYSDLRFWLNNDFMREAFVIEEQNKILDTVIVNDYSIGYYKNKYEYMWIEQNETTDKAFLLSYEDIINEEIGFSPDIKEDKLREAILSDFVRAKGAWMSTVKDFYGNSMFYWLRSTGDDSYKISFVNNYGYVLTTGNDVSSEKGGFRPAIIIDKENK